MINLDETNEKVILTTITFSLNAVSLKQIIETKKKEKNKNYSLNIVYWALIVKEEKNH